MKKPLFLSLGMALCLLLTSCVVTSDNPLSPPETAKPDVKLLGKWQSKDDPDEVDFFTIKNEHWMHLEIQKKDRPSDSYDLFPTIIGKQKFLNVIQLVKDDKGNITRQGYYIVLYDISPDHVLSTRLMDQDKAAALVKSGKLKGIVKQNGDSSSSSPLRSSHPDVDITLQSTGADLIKFIQNSGTEAFFSDKASTMTPIKTVER
jgi:hypothetical protein